MALGAATQWELQTGGSDSNGGGFDPGCAGFATDLAATSANTASPVVSSASYNFVSGDVGAWLFIQSGTDWIPGWYQIASVAANAATLNAAVGAVTLYPNTTGPFPLNTVAGISDPPPSLGSGTWGIDYSRSTTPQIAYTDMVIGATTTQFTSVANPVGVNIVGNIINVTSGTGFVVQQVEVLSVATLVATCDKSLGSAASTGGNGNLGGAILAWSNLFGLIEIANIGWIRTGTYTITTALGAPSPTSGVAQFFGYGSTRGDGARATLTTATNSTTLINTGGHNAYQFANIYFSNTAATPARCLECNGGGAQDWRFSNCVFDGFTSAIWGSFSGDYNFSGVLDGCEFKNQSGTSFYVYLGGPCQIFGCYFHDNTGYAIYQDNIANGGPLTIVGNIFYGNGHDIEVTVADNVLIESNDFVSTTGDSVVFTQDSPWPLIVNNIFSNVGGYDVNWSGGDSAVVLWFIQSNAHYNPGSGRYNGLIRNAGDIILTGSPFTNPSGGDFSLNDTAGAGALCRGAAYPQSIGAASNYRDVGALQHTAGGVGRSHGLGLLTQRPEPVIQPAAIGPPAIDRQGDRDQGRDASELEQDQSHRCPFRMLPFSMAHSPYQISARDTETDQWPPSARPSPPGCFPRPRSPRSWAPASTLPSPVSGRRSHV